MPSPEIAPLWWSTGHDATWHMHHGHAEKTLCDDWPAAESHAQRAAPDAPAAICAGCLGALAGRALFIAE